MAANTSTHFVKMATPLAPMLLLDWHAPAGLALCAAGAGVVSHLGYFIRGEHHKQGWTMVKLYATLLLANPALLWHYLHLSPLAAVVRALMLALSYAAGVCDPILTRGGSNIDAQLDVFDTLDFDMGTFVQDGMYF